MENELLRIFNDYHKPIGIATREDVHKLGYWHETFHCWFISKENNTNYIYIQLRSDVKKDYPNLLDITAAGHILAHETTNDGIREIQEELGVETTLCELVKLGIINYCVKKEDFIDKEIAHVFLYNSSIGLEDFTLQTEEVSGIVRVPLLYFYNLWYGKKEEIHIEGYKINMDGKKELMNGRVNRSHFVPHEEAFYQTVVSWICDKVKA